MTARMFATMWVQRARSGCGAAITPRKGHWQVTRPGPHPANVGGLSELQRNLFYSQCRLGFSGIAGLLPAPASVSDRRQFSPDAVRVRLATTSISHSRSLAIRVARVWGFHFAIVGRAGSRIHATMYIGIVIIHRKRVTTTIRTRNITGLVPAVCASPAQTPPIQP
jgi:hypothetical protein